MTIHHEWTSAPASRAMTRTTQATAHATDPPAMMATSLVSNGGGSGRRSRDMTGTLRAARVHHRDVRLWHPLRHDDHGHGAAERRTPRPGQRLRPLLHDLRARLDAPARGPRWVRDVLHDGLHRRAQPAHHRYGEGPRRADPRPAEGRR